MAPRERGPSRSDPDRRPTRRGRADDDLPASRRGTRRRRHRSAPRRTPTGPAAGADTAVRGGPVESEPRRHRPVLSSRWPDPGPTRTGPADDPRRSDVDEWGRSEHMRSLVRRLYDPMYKHWFRVEWEGLEKIPDQGGALLVANHAGAIPSDAPVIMHGIEKELGPPGLRPGRLLLPHPAGGRAPCGRATGGVPAHPDNAYRLLHDQQQLALVFPEGTKATSKTYTDRYRLRRFGRGGFVEIAMRAGVPVIPIAVVGAEESMPILFRLPSVAKALEPALLPGHGQRAPRWAPRVRDLLPGQVQAAGARPGDLRRPARPGPLLPEPGHGRGRAHPGPDAGRALRHAARAPQRLVRLIRWVAASWSPGSTPSGAGAWPRPSRPSPTSR